MTKQLERFVSTCHTAGMKNKNKLLPAFSKLNLLRQICNFIPEFLVSTLARETGVEKKARTFKPWSHLIALLYAQLTHSIGLNDAVRVQFTAAGPKNSKHLRSGVKNGPSVLAA
ncbi:MAG TPA: DUF4372 domain-containing protein, partial [Lacipirellulaceae bacterium]|nr:DUF4372 domain-containing protein [Lacipirellulaceae bacterium]